MGEKRKRLKSKQLWTKAIFNRFRIPIDYSKSVEIIDKVHAEFIKFVETKHRPVCINKQIGNITFCKHKPKKKIYMQTEGEGVKLLVNHDTQGYIYRYMFKPVSTEKMIPYKLFPARKINRALKDKIKNRELR